MLCGWDNSGKNSELRILIDRDTAEVYKCIYSLSNMFCLDGFDYQIGAEKTDSYGIMLAPPFSTRVSVFCAVSLLLSFHSSDDLFIFFVELYKVALL